MPEPSVTAAVASQIAKVAGWVFPKLDRAAQEWVSAEAKRQEWTYNGRSLKLAWLTFRGRYERERLAATGEDWPPARCIRCRLRPAREGMDRYRDSVRVDGGKAGMSFRLVFGNVAPFAITLRQFQVTCSVWLPHDGRMQDECQWKLRETVPGYQNILPGEELVVPFNLDPIDRTFPDFKVTQGTTHVAVQGHAAVLGPWKAHEQRIDFYETLWLPTLVN